MKRLKLHVSKENQETINKYNQDCKIVENLRPSSLRNNNVFLRKLADYLGNKTFKECTIDDLKRFFDTVNYNDKEPLKVAIRKFYKWLYQTDDYPPIVKWIKLKTILTLQTFLDSTKHSSLVKLRHCNLGHKTNAKIAHHRAILMSGSDLTSAPGAHILVKIILSHLDLLWWWEVFDGS
jgi:site-specific recombinase XerD